MKKLLPGLLLALCLMSPVYAVVPDSVVIELAKVARDNITHAQMSGGGNVPAESAEEKKQPILPMADTRRAVEQGLKTGMISGCGLAWQSEFTGFMQGERSKKIWTPKQIAYIGLLHGVSQGYMEGAMKDKGCSAEMKTTLQKKLK